VRITTLLLALLALFAADFWALWGLLAVSVFADPRIPQWWAEFVLVIAALLVAVWLTYRVGGRVFGHFRHGS
jgi:hypothetical protein